MPYVHRVVEVQESNFAENVQNVLASVHHVLPAQQPSHEQIAVIIQGLSHCIQVCGVRKFLHFAD